MFISESSLPLPASSFIRAAGSLVASSPAIAWCQFDQACWQETLHQQWHLPLPATLQGAVLKRKAEFLASRWLVQQQLEQWGIANFLLRNAADRSPIWPPGIQASLSHSHGWVVMAATQAPLCVGIDVEEVMTDKIARETAEMLMSPAEHALLTGLPLPFAQAATLLFSLKESVYKALWPQLHQPMEFHQAVLTALDLHHHQASLRLTHAFSPAFTQQTPLQARFWLQPDRVITLLTHPLPGQ